MGRAEQLHIPEAEHTLAINSEKALRTTAPAWEALKQNYYVASWGYDIYDVDKRASKVLEITPFSKDWKALAYYIKVLEKTLHPFYLAVGDRFIPMAVGDRWMRVSNSLQPLFKLQNQDIEAMKGHEMKLYYNGALLLTYVLDTIPKIEKVFETLQNLVNIYEQPNSVKVSIAADKKITIAYSKEIDIELPYVLRDYPITHVKESEQFTYTIIYKHPKSNTKISEKKEIKFASDSEKTRSYCENKIKSEVIKLAGAGSFNFTYMPTDASIRTGFSIRNDIKIILSSKFADILDLPTVLQKDNENVWIASNIVSDTQVGSECYPLLTPDPISLNEQVLDRKYVPVKLDRINNIEIKIYHDLRNQLYYTDYKDIYITLHFTPRKTYKRLRLDPNTINHV